MIKLSKSVVGEEEFNAVRRVLVEDGYLGMGKEVGFFEEDLARYLAIPRERVICVNSGTAALHLACTAILKPGDEVLVQSMTFVATFQAIAASGALPIACEIDDNITIDLDDARRKLTSKTKAIMPVHYAGNPANLENIYRFAEENSLRVIEDAAHAFGSKVNGNKIGSVGDIVCFSFDGIKNITCAEGGVVLVANQQEADAIRDARLLGVHNDSQNRLKGQRSWDFTVTAQGYRYHMSNIMAAIGREQLKKFSTFSKKRQDYASCYAKMLSNIRDVALFELDRPDIVPHIYPIRVKRGKRDELREFLKQACIETGIHYKPNHLHPFFESQFRFSKTEEIYNELLSLPLHPGLEKSDINYVCDKVKTYMGCS